MLSPQELAEYARIMRDSGILQFKQDGVEIVLSPQLRMMPLEGGSNNGPPPRVLTDEDYMFAATEGLPEDGN